MVGEWLAALAVTAVAVLVSALLALAAVAWHEGLLWATAVDVFVWFARPLVWVKEFVAELVSK